MGELEPSVLVVPSPFIVELVVEPEGKSIEVEYFQEDVDGEFGNCYVTSRGRITITGMVMWFQQEHWAEAHVKLLNIPLQKKSFWLHIDCQ